MPQAGREANRIQSVLKALDIMECLAAADRPLSAQEVARRCSTSRPTAYRYLTTLLDRGYVTTRQHNSHYQIGAQVLGLGKSFLTLDMAARVSRGGWSSWPWPAAAWCRQRHTSAFRWCARGSFFEGATEGRAWTWTDGYT